MTHQNQTTTHRDQLLQEPRGNRSDMKESVLNHRHQDDGGGEKCQTLQRTEIFGSGSVKVLRA